MTTNHINHSELETIVENMCKFIWSQAGVGTIAEFHRYMEDIIFERDAYEDGRYIFTYKFEEVFCYVPSRLLEPLLEFDVGDEEIKVVMQQIYPKWRHAM